MDRILANRARLERHVLATLLPAIAGAVNASGFFAVGTYTSHMTGVVSRLGDELAQGHWSLAGAALLVLSSFMLGAGLCSALILHAQNTRTPPFWRPLLLEAAILFCFASVNVGGERGAHLNSATMTALLCIGMGVQNALVTTLSGTRIRTTHLTGVTTDIGIELARLLARLRGERARGAAASPGLAWKIWRDQETRHLRLHLRILLCFLAGATGGPALYLVVGHWAILIPVVLLIGLAAFDLRTGLGSREGGPAAEPTGTAASRDLVPPSGD